MVVDLKYKPVPTLLRFHRDGQDIIPMTYDNATGRMISPGKNYIRCVMGPIGSGKSVGCINELFFQACTQWKNPEDNYRRSRIAIVRDTYTNLEKTTLETFYSWFTRGKLTEVKQTPHLTLTWDFDLAEDDHVHCEFICLALDSPKALENLKSLEISGAFVNECMAIDIDTINMLIDRVGRFPGGKKDPGGNTRSFIIMDTNPPNIGNWYQIYKDEILPRGWKFYDQPPALLYSYDAANNKYTFEPNVGQDPKIPAAENIENLGEGWGYYMKTVDTADPSYTLVFKCMKYGEVGNGSAVYMTYNDDVHCAKYDLPFNPTLPLILGFDFGVNAPACVFAQYTPYGQLQVLDEVFKKGGIGMSQFFSQYIHPKLVNEYGLMKGTELIAVGDPSGNKRSDTDASTCIDMLNGFGIPVVACLTNTITMRLESVRSFLNTNAAGKPSFLLSPRCEMLRRGFQGLYRFETIKGDLLRLKEEPTKNDFSHLQDALQYVCHRVRFSHEYSRNGIFGLWGGDNRKSDLAENPTYGRINALIC